MLFRPLASSASLTARSPLLTEWFGPKASLSSEAASGSESPHAATPVAAATVSAKTAAKRNLRAIDVFHRTIGSMSLCRVGALLSTLAITVNAASAEASRILVMDGRGAVHARNDRFVAPAPRDERRTPARAH